MKIIDNVNQTVKDDLKAGIRSGSKLSIAAACFSIYHSLTADCTEIQKLLSAITKTVYLSDTARTRKHLIF